MEQQGFWPDSEAFLDLSLVKQVTDGRARCTGVAVCDADGYPRKSFFQGQEVHFFYEFEILCDVEVPSGGLELSNAYGQVIYGKNTFQFGTPVPESLRVGKRLRYHHA